MEHNMKCAMSIAKNLLLIKAIKWLQLQKIVVLHFNRFWLRPDSKLTLHNHKYDLHYHPEQLWCFSHQRFLFWIYLTNIKQHEVVLLWFQNLNMRTAKRWRSYTYKNLLMIINQQFLLSNDWFWALERQILLNVMFNNKMINRILTVFKILLLISSSYIDNSNNKIILQNKIYENTKNAAYILNLSCKATYANKCFTDVSWTLLKKPGL